MTLPTKKLGEVCEIVGGGTPSTAQSSYWGSDYFWITPKDLGRLDTIEISKTERKISKEGLENSSAKLLPIDSVILSTRAPIGYVVISKVEMTTNQGCRSFICGKQILSRYLYHFLKLNTDYLNSLGSGSTFREVSGSRLKKIEIPLPPIAEQKGIVAKIEKQFAKIDEAARLRAESAELAAKLLPAALHEIFSSAESKGWEYRTIGEVADHSLGKVLDRHKNKGTPKKYLRNANVRWFGFDLSNLKEMKFEEDEEEKYTAVKGDVLICEGGYPGRAAIWEEDSPIYFQNAAHRVRFHEPVCARWFVYFLYHSDLSGELQDRLTGVGIKHFTGRALDKLKIPLPPLAEQKTIVKKLDVLAERARTLRALQSSQSADFTALKQYILHEAFSA